MIKPFLYLISGKYKIPSGLISISSGFNDPKRILFIFSSNGCEDNPKYGSSRTILKKLKGFKI